MTYIEAKTQQKIAYLQRLLKLRVRLMRFATDVDVSVNYPETKDFGASWADQSNLQSYLHTL